MGGGVAGCTPDLEDADVTAGGGERRIKREDDVLVGPQLRHVGQVLGDRFAGAGDRVAVDQPVLQQMFHDHRHSADVALLQSESGTPWISKYTQINATKKHTTQKSGTKGTIVMRRGAPGKCERNGFKSSPSQEYPVLLSRHTRREERERTNYGQAERC